MSVHQDRGGRVVRGISGGENWLGRCDTAVRRDVLFQGKGQYGPLHILRYFPSLFPLSISPLYLTCEPASPDCREHSKSSVVFILTKAMRVFDVGGILSSEYIAGRVIQRL